MPGHMEIHRSERPRFLEYVAMVAMVTSIGAMGTDLMLPALDEIGRELGAENANDVHFIVTTFFLGMAGGQLIVGPLSDSFGRKPVIYAGYGVFVIGCLISVATENWYVMLASRALQGLGAAAPRIVVVAMVRDEYQGRAMARVMSMVMAAFIIVPIVAPAMGQGLIYAGGWKATFAGLIVLAIIVSLWFGSRQPETLAVEDRRAFRIREIRKGIIEIVRTRVAFGYTLATGFTFGMFLGYLGSAQQIFQVTFGTGDLFVVYFALSAVSLGTASLLNASLVMRLGMKKLTWWALSGLTGLSLAFWATLPLFEGVPPLPIFLIWQLSTFFCVGIIFGNLNTLALDPLGHIAGLGAAFVGSIATFISLPLAAVIGQRFDGTVVPLVAGFAIYGAIACAIMNWTKRSSDSAAEV